MKRFRKYTAGLLLLVLVLGVSACGNSDNNGGTANTPNTENATDNNGNGTTNNGATTDGTVNNNNVYNANFAPRPALMELPCTSSPCGESRGPSSKEAISRRPWT